MKKTWLCDGREDCIDGSIDYMQLLRTHYFSSSDCVEDISHDFIFFIKALKCLKDQFECVDDNHIVIKGVTS